MNCFKEKLLILTTAIFVISFAQKSEAQFDAQLSQYMLLPGYFNPAGICEGSDLNVAVSSRQQWVKFDNAPSTFLLHASMPKVINNKKHGFGLLIMKESIGLFDNQLLQAQYSWKKEIWGSTLSLGFQGGLLQQNFDASGIHIPTSDYHNGSDISIPTGNLEALIPDFSAGIWIRKNNLHAGFSASHLLETRLKLKAGDDISDTTRYKTYASRTFYLTGGYNIVTTNPLYTLQPSFLLKSDLNVLQTDISLRLWYKEKFWGTLGWRPGDAMIVSAGMKLEQGLTIGYSYDISTRSLSTVSGGSHEIFVGYVKKIDTATTSKKQKSVRIL